MRVIGLQKLLTFGAIRLIKLEIYGQKNRDGAFPPPKKKFLGVP